MLFSEELGAVLQVRADDRHTIHTIAQKYGLVDSTHTI